MLCWYETLGVRLQDEGQCARFCAFSAKVHRGGKLACVHKGKLFLPAEERKVIVKTFADRATATAECQAVLEKQKAARELLRSVPELRKSVALVPQFSAAVAESHAYCKWFSRSARSLKVGTPVLIQERLKEQDIVDFRGLFAERMTSPRDESHSLLKLARESFVESQGNRVILGAKGYRSKEKGVVRYHLTSLIVHSTDQRYGYWDEGEDGILRVLEATGMEPNSCQRPQLFRIPSAPPHDEESEDNVQLPKHCDKEKDPNADRVGPIDAEVHAAGMQLVLLALGARDVSPSYGCLRLLPTGDQVPKEMPPPYSQWS